MVRDQLSSVIGWLAAHEGLHSKGHYYSVRARYNVAARRGEVHGPERAAMFIYLNRTCFNGLHRVNRKGEFNVPIGSYKNPRILDREGLRAASFRLQATELVAGPFEEAAVRLRPGDFVYLDPPYEPAEGSGAFTGYAKDGFDREDQGRLRKLVDTLAYRDVFFMLSNSDVPFIRDLYSGYQIDTVVAPRAISRNGAGRVAVSELVIRNY
jgi:DNA adenine methylase